MLPYAFVLGMSHSGSTLLAFLLNAHPEIACIGETSRLSQLLPSRWRPGNDRCSGGVNDYACEVWNRRQAGMAARGQGLGGPDFFEYPRREKKQADLKLSAFVESLLNAAGARVFADASKHPQLVRPLVANPHLDLQLLNLTRDGRAIINSWRKNRPDSPRENVIRRWLRQEKRREEALRLLPPSGRLDIRYEDLAQDPPATLHSIFEFLAVDPDVDVTEGYKSRVPHHIVGNRMRLDSGESVIFEERWRRELPSNWMETFRRMGGLERNRALGYEA